MLDQKIRGLWDRVVRPVGRAIGASGLSANAVTTLGLLIQVGVAWAILDGRLVLAGLIAIGAALADGLDGAVAKAKGTTSSFGALYDSTTDRLADALYFAPIAWLYGVAPDIPAHDQPWVAAVAVVTLVASFLVSYVRARAEGLGFDCKVGIAERAERVILLILGLLFGFLPIALSILGVLSIITFIQRVLHVRAQAT
jgi:CDP-diacylglycerol--glycerol-3-phosphate 3-phosphatidyltransferase